jgi:hypothetical protein
LRKAWAGVPLSAEDEASYEQERLEHNRRIVRALVRVLVPIHALTTLMFWGALGPQGSSDLYRRAVVQIHLLAIPGSILVSWLVVWVEPRWHPGRWRGWAVDLFAGFYLLVAAALSTNAQRLNGNVNVFVLVALTTAILFRLHGKALAILGLSGSIALTFGILNLVHGAAARIAVISPVVAVWVIAIVAAQVQAVTVRRELASRRETERGRAELAAQQEVLRGLNDDLERRVTEQVQEIVVPEAAHQPGARSLC